MGGIVGRGVLVDFFTWATSKGETINPNSHRPITLSEVLEVLEFQKTKILPGDILIFRTGWLAWYTATDKEERHTELCIRNDPGKHSFIGLAPERDFVAWLWNNQIAAVAGDQVAFECTPPPEGGFGWLHEHLLSALGCPIGELWNTEELAKTCKESGRYSFLLVSAPLHVNGGVASTSNALAIL
jgi:kynurenine formamidase